MVPSSNLMRLWELAGHAMADPGLPLALASQLEPSKLGLYGYLFATTATLRDGLRAGIDFVHLVSTCSRVRIEAEAGRETTYSCRHVGAGGRGAELGLQFCVASFCALARAGTGRPVAPVHVGFAQSAPSSYQAFTKTLGTRRVDFGTSITTFTFHARDLDLPMRGADPALARVLRRYAATLPAPAPVTWYERFQHVLDEAIGLGRPSLEAMAAQLAVSPRTLQRRLAEHGTTWRTELDAARQHRARLAGQDGPPAMTSLARQLGYAGPRSARRALRRWNDTATEPAAWPQRPVR
jgi:AraC-like DNA-binding protein